MDEERRSQEEVQFRYNWFGRAAKHGILQTIQCMLTCENPVPVDCICRPVKKTTNVCYEHVTPLLLACREGHLAIVQELIRAGADVNWKQMKYKTPPHVACQNGGSPASVETVSKVDACVDATAVIIGTPLHEACRYGQSPEVVEALLAAGANVNATVYGGYHFEYTPLMAIATSKAPITSQLTIARLLLAANCDVNHETEDGDTALVCACGHCDSGELVRWLIEHGARVTPRALSACFNYSNQNAEIVKISCLLEHGMDINATDEEGRTAILWAAKTSNKGLVRLLLDHNADVSVQDQNGRTALMELIDNIFKDYEIPFIVMLMKRMISVDKKLVDIQDVDGYTALHFAANRNSWRVIHHLLNWEPDLLCRTSNGLYTALHYARFSMLSNIRCLVEHANGYGLNGLNIQDKQGRTVLHLALEDAGSNKSVIDYLSTIVDVSIQDVEGNTALHIAVTCDHSEIIVPMILHSRHATQAANALNRDGRTPLHEAILFRKNSNLVQAIGQIADVNIRNSHDGRTALHYALTGKATDCVDLLLLRNANVSVLDNDGNTALSLACNMCDDKSHAQLSIIFRLYKHGIAYGEVLNTI